MGIMAHSFLWVILSAARRPPRPGRMLGGRHDARSGAFAFAGCRGAASAG